MSKYQKSPQGGVSGNKSFGATAIVVSGKWPGADTYEHLLYTAKRHNGALALQESYHHGYPVRVFRSSVYDSEYGVKGTSRPLYRYDGLYEIKWGFRPAELNPKGNYAFWLKQMSDRKTENIFDCK